MPEDQQNSLPSFGETADTSWCLQPFKPGGGYAVAWGERQLSPGQRIFVFTVDYVKAGMPVTAKAIAHIQAVLKADFNETVRTHRAWWQTYYPRSFLSVPDTRMESFYWIQSLLTGTTLCWRWWFSCSPPNGR